MCCGRHRTTPTEPPCCIAGHYASWRWRFTLETYRATQGISVKAGYLAVETHQERPGLVRLTLTPEPPHTSAQPPGDRRVRYVARFNDGDAALMHTHEILRWRLLDLQTRIYRVAFERAIAAIDALDLKHRGIYLDPALSDTARAAIAATKQRFINARRRKDRLFELAGYLGIALLLLNLYALSLT